MIYSLSGKLIVKKPQFAVIETNGIGFKILISHKTLKNLPKIGSKSRFFCYTNVRQDGIEFYGFLEEKELEFFEMLNSIDGVGPKGSLKIMNTMKIESLLAAVSKNRVDLLTKISGIGRKRAQKIILELGDKIQLKDKEIEIAIMESNSEIGEVLKALGYKQNQIREATKKIPEKLGKLEEKIKFALKILSAK